MRRTGWNRTPFYDFFWPLNEWPLQYRRLWLSPHISNPERFQLALFWRHNGLSPDLIRDLFATWVLDAEAWRQVNWILTQLANDWNPRWTTWDMIVGCNTDRLPPP